MVTMIITKWCGKIPLSFALVLFNLEHQQDKLENLCQVLNFPLCCCMCLYHGPTKQTMVLSNPWSTYFVWLKCYLLTVSNNSMFIFVGFDHFFFRKWLLFFIYFPSNWWKFPFKGGFLLPQVVLHNDVDGCIIVWSAEGTSVSLCVRASYKRFSGDCPYRKDQNIYFYKVRFNIQLTRFIKYAQNTVHKIKKTISRLSLQVNRLFSTYPNQS